MATFVEWWENNGLGLPLGALCTPEQVTAEMCPRTTGGEDTGQDHHRRAPGGCWGLPSECRAGTGHSSSGVLLSTPTALGGEEGLAEGGEGEAVSLTESRRAQASGQ